MSGDKYLKIDGERFVIAHEGDMVHLRHPEWSLGGMGANLEAAQRDVIQEARRILAEHDAAARHSAGYDRMIQFCVQVIG